MPKQTLLDIVQEVLSSMDSDEVNSISDNVEAQQVALVVRRVYFDLVTRSNLSEHYDLFQLTASGDSSKPILMYRPDNVTELSWLKYDKKTAAIDSPHFDYVRYVEPTEFFERMHAYSTSESGIGSCLYLTHTLLYRTDRAPETWTTVDDRTLIFDAVNLSLDNTLQQSKTMAYGRLEPVFDIHSDSFVPDLDAALFPLLVNEAKSLAWAEMKQAQHAKAETESRKQRVHMYKTNTGLAPDSYGQNDNLPNYGRK